MTTSLQVTPEPFEPLAVDGEEATARLSEALRIKTVSHQDRGKVEGAAFLELHALIEAGFPAVHAALEREIVNDYSLLYTWRGSAREAPPIILAAGSPSAHTFWKEEPRA